CPRATPAQPHAKPARCVDISASQRGKEGGRNDVAIAEQAVTRCRYKSSARQPVPYFRRPRRGGGRGDRPPKEECEHSSNDAHCNPHRARTPYPDAGSE